MGTVADKLNHLLETKTQMRTTIAAKGVEVPETATFRDYSALIDSIPTSGTSDLHIAFGDAPPEDTSKLWVNTDARDMVILNPNYNRPICRKWDSTTYKGRSRVLCAVGKTIYSISGMVYGSFTLDWGAMRNYVSIIDTETETMRGWQFKDETGFESTAATGAVAVGNKIYQFGGAYNVFEESRAYSCNEYITIIDTETETATRAAVSLPNDTFLMAAVAVGTKIYLFGGLYRIGTTNFTYEYSNDIYMFDTEQETLTLLETKLPHSGSISAAVSVGTKIYLFGGCTKIFNNMTTTSNIYMFNTETGNINILGASLLTGTFEMGVGFVGDKVYLFGGVKYESGVPTAYDTVQIFDTTNETIVLSDYTMPAKLGCGAVTIGNRVYVVGGYDYDLNECVDSIYEYNIGGLLLPNQILAYPRAIYIGDENGTPVKVPAYLYENGSWTEI